jgi:hypothetical protein
MRALILTLLFVFTAGLARGEAPELLFIRPWIELAPLVGGPAGPSPLPVDTAEKTLLEQGRYLLSGMVYGWTFVYRPGDKARRVEESFILTPVAQIPWGSSRLAVRETVVAEGKLWARISYAMNDDESRWRSSWQSSTASLSSGQGTADLLREPDAWNVALREAIRNAIRLSLDTRYVNKPREIDGEVLLWEDPSTVLDSGSFITTAKVKLQVRQLVPYRIY